MTDAYLTVPGGGGGGAQPAPAPAPVAPAPAPRAAPQRPQADVDRAREIIRGMRGGDALRTMQDVAGQKPDDHALALKVQAATGESLNTARAVVRGDPMKARTLAERRAALLQGRPAFARWMEDPSNATIANDDIEQLARVHDAVGGHDVGFWDGVGNAKDQGAQQLANELVALASISGAVDPYTAGGMIAQGARAQADLQAAAPAEMREFDEAEGFFGKVAELPGALPYLAARAAPGFGPPMLGGMAGGALGAVASGPLAGGILAAAPATGPLAPGMAVAAGAVEAGGTALGGLAGTYYGFKLPAKGAAVLAALQRRGVVLTDDMAVGRALADPALRAEIGAEAEMSSTANAALTAVLMKLFPAGALTRKAEGVAGKAVGVAKELPLQTATQLAGPVAGELAATGKVDAAALPGQAVEAATMALGFTLHATFKDAQARQRFAKAAAAVQDGDALQRTVEAVRESKVPPRNEKRAADFLREKAAREGVDDLSIPRETWDAAQQAAGRSPRDEAAKLTGSPLAYDEAVSTGSLVAPHERAVLVMAKDDALAKALLPEIRVRPGQPSPAEAVEQMGQMLQAAQAAEAAPREVAIEAARQAAADERRAGELEAELGLPPDGDRLMFQGPLKPHAEVMAEAQASGSRFTPEQIAAERLQEAQARVNDPDPAVRAAAQAEVAELSPLRAAADAIEAVKPGLVGKVAAAITGRDLVAEAVRATLLSSAEPATTATTRPAATGAQQSGSELRRGVRDSRPDALIEAVAQAAQRDPVATAAKLRELADIRARQAATQPALEQQRRTFEAAIRAAGRPALEAKRAARVLAAFVSTMQARFPEVPRETWDRLMVRFVRGKAPEGAQPQGERGAYDPATRTIHLFDGQDPSTVIHEAAHWMVDVIDLAAAEQPALADLNREIRGLVGMAETDGPLSPAQHEAIARSFEGYVRTGEAPSIGLRRAFAALKDALVRIYASLRDLIGADELPKATRELFDRLLATDAEIEAATRERGPAPLLTPEEAAAAGIRPESYDAFAKAAVAARDVAAESMTRKVLADMGREQIAARRATLERLTAEERARLNQTPAFVAVANMKDGTLPDGSPLPEGQPRVRLDKEATAAQYDAGTVRKLDPYFGEDGVSPEIAAELFGFETGGDLLNALIANKNLDRVVDATARQRLAAEHPELYRDPMARRDEARRSLDVGDARADLIDAEIAALKEAQRTAEKVAGPERKRADRAEKATAKAEARAGVAEAEVAVGKAESARAEQSVRSAFDRIPTRKAAREAARVLIADKPVRDIKPHVYLDAVARERTAASERAKIGEHEEAAAHLGQSRMNEELYREAVSVRDAAEADRNGILRIRTPGRQEAMGKAGGEWQVQANKMAARFGLGRLAPDQLAAAKPISDWMKQIEDQAGATGDTFVPMVASWLRSDAFSAPWDALTPARLHELRTAVESIYKIARDRFNAHSSISGENLMDRTVAVAQQVVLSHAKLDRNFQAKPTFTQNISAEHTPIDRYVYEIDGGDSGPLHDAILFPRNEGEADLELRRINDDKTWSAAFQRFPASERAVMGIHRPVPGVGRKLSHEQRLMIVLYEGHAGGREQNRNTFTDAEIDAIKRTMTATDAAWLNDTWSFSNQDWPELRDHMQRVYGVVPPKVEGIPFSITNAAGETFDLTGGYSKIKHAGEHAHVQSEAEIAADLARGRSVKSMTRLGARHERVQGVKHELRYDFGVVLDGKAEARTALALTERLYDIRFVLNQPTVRDAIVERHGLEVYRQFTDAMNALAGGSIKEQSAGNTLSSWLRNGTIYTKLGFKLGTQVLNATGIANSVNELGPEVLHEVGKYAADPRGFMAAVRQMHDESTTMATRATALSREQYAIRGQLNQKFDLTGVRTASMLPQAAVQLWVDTVTYFPAKRRALAEGHNEAQAIRIAEQVVKDTQGSGFPADVPKIMRDHNLLTLFMGFPNRTLNLLVRNAKTADSRLEATYRVATGALLMLALPAAAMYGYGKLRGDKDREGLWLSLASDSFGGLFSGVFAARDIASAVRFSNYNGPAGLAFGGDVGDAVRGLSDGRLSAYDVRSIATALGTLTHLPLGALTEAVQGAQATAAGRAGPAAVLTGPPR